MKNRRYIRKAVLAYMVVSVLGASAHADDVDEQLATRPYKQEVVGISAGAVIGALIGGPPGFIIGAASGNLIGRGFGSEQELKQTRLELAQAQQQLATLRMQVTEKQVKVNTHRPMQLASLKSLHILESNSIAPEITDGFYMTVQFRTGSHTLEPHFKEQLKKLAVSLKTMPSINITLQGYADPRGGETYNQNLSDKRINSVMNVLHTSGIDTGRVHMKSFGESNLLSNEQNGESYTFDRRVLITLSRGDQAS